MNYRNTLKNKTFTYVFPMIEDIINYPTNLKACYVGDIEKSEYSEHILLEYEFDESFKDMYFKFEEEIQKCTYFEDFYDTSEGNIVFIFRVPEQYKNDYKLFMESKYSEFSTKYKDKIIEFHGVNNEHITKGVLFKTKERYEAIKAKISDVLTGESVLTYQMEFESVWDKALEIKNYSSLSTEKIKTLKNESST